MFKHLFLAALLLSGLFVGAGQAEARPRVSTPTRPAIHPFGVDAKRFDRAAVRTLRAHLKSFKFVTPGNFDAKTTLAQHYKIGSKGIAVQNVTILGDRIFNSKRLQPNELTVSLTLAVTKRGKPAKVYMDTVAKKQGRGWTLQMPGQGKVSLKPIGTDPTTAYWLD